MATSKEVETNQEVQLKPALIKQDSCPTNHEQNQITTQPKQYPLPLPEINDEEKVIAEEMAKKGAKHHKKWNRRLKVFFCCLGYKKNKDSIADVASIFAEFFSDLNVPSSDIAAAFVLLSKYQEAQRNHIIQNQQFGVEQYLSCIPIKEDTKFLDISTPEDSYLINDLIYFMNYGLAIFGWPLQVVEDPCTICCIYPYLRLAPCCSRRRKAINCEEAPKSKESDGSINNGAAPPSDEKDKSVRDRKNAVFKPTNQVPGQLDEINNVPIILEDNCCSCNYASAERRLAAHNYDIIYITYRTAIGVVPFLVAADHAKRTVVVAIRGSMSLSDMVTDMNGTIDKLPIENCPDDWLCHRGITKAASYVKTTLLQENLLERAFNCRPDLGSQEYNLLLCGHSLGAGAAAILGVLLYNQYPTLKAYLYSPPGGILSLPVVEFTKKFAVGVILGNDTVARLGVAQLERLRYQTLLSLQSSDKSTSKILARALCPTFCFGKNKVDYDPDQSLDLLYGTRGRSFDYNGTKIPFQVQNQVLYVPGRLMHIVRNYTFKSRAQRLFRKPIFQAVWTENQTYDRVLINKGMLLDHLPHNLMQSMKMLFSNTIPGRRDSKLSQSNIQVVDQSPRNVASMDKNLADDRQQSSDLAEIPKKLDKVITENVDIIGSESVDNNNVIGEKNGNIYPFLKSTNLTTEQVYRFDSDHDKNDSKGVCDDIDENGNEKTIL